MDNKSEVYLFSLVLLSGLLRCSGVIMFWTAYVKVSYLDSMGNQTVNHLCECGLYGRDSPRLAASGIVVLPASDPLGCGSDPVYSPNNSVPWIALIKRGNCSFSDKINAAKRQGADGVVIYNLDLTGNIDMAHQEAQGIVAIMIGNVMGMDLVNLVQSGVEVTMVIEVGKLYKLWVLDTCTLYFLSISFFVVLAASIGYFIFVSGQRLRILRGEQNTESRLKSEAKKAIGRLEVRTLKRDDEEIGSDSHTCAVCIDSYKPGEVVTVLTCGHFYHKACIEPWLLEKRTCPMCKCDILKALGVDAEEEKDGSPNSPPDVTVVTVSGEEHLYNVPLTDTSTPELARHQDPHHYNNVAFEGESQIMNNMAARG
ncbi:E3 ubiquitin-protein ligase RNF128-like [Osmerus eperlanus]|uniref:E3 ubiquitin-protein ligase RNF128-like n=1 Tax=Osmerus eperlanus TaxID=29151 RepID=UPI002E164823